MAYELPEQTTGLNLSATPEGPPVPGIPTSVPPQVADTNFGMVNLPGYTPAERAAALAPAPSFADKVARIGLALEGFGSGYRGQEPLYLKLRRQQAVEDANQLERKLKIEQFQVQRAHQDWTETGLIMDKLKDDPKAGLNVLQQRAKAGSPSARVMLMSGVGTKDFAEIPHLMPVIQELDPEGYGMVQQAIQTNTVDKLDPMRLRGMKERATAEVKRRDEISAESRDWARLEKLDPASMSDADLALHADLSTKRAKREEEREKIRLSRMAMAPDKPQGERDLAAGVNTPAAISTKATAQAQATKPFTLGTEFQNSLASALFGGKTYGQLTAPEQKKVLDYQREWEQQGFISKAMGAEIGKDLAPLNERASEYRTLKPGGILEPATQVESARSASSKGYVNVGKHMDVMKQYEATQNLNKALADLAPLSKQLFTAHPGLVNVAKQATRLMFDSWSRGGKQAVNPPPDYSGKDAAQPSAVVWDGQQLTVGQAYNLYRDLTVQAMEAYQRGLFAMKGAGTEGDVSRGLSGLPTIGATPEEAGLKFNNVIMWSLDSQRSALKELGFKAEDIDRSLMGQLPPPVKDKPTLESHLQSYGSQIKRLRFSEPVMKEVLIQEGIKWKQRHPK